MFKYLKQRAKNKEVVEEFKNFLFNTIFIIGDLADKTEDSIKTIEIFVERHENLPTRQQVLLDKLKEVLCNNDSLSHRERIKRFTFELFFIVHEGNYNVDIQLEFREDFYTRTDNAYDTNAIFRE